MKENQNLDVNLQDELNNDDILIKTNNNLKLNEPDLLRKDSKTLLWSLMQHQNVIKQSFSKLINNDNEIEEYDNVNNNITNATNSNELIEDQLDQDNSDDENLRINLKNRYSNLRRSQDSLRFFEETELVTKYNNNNNKTTIKRGKKMASASTTGAKTVSFCDYLRTCCDDDDTCSTGSRRRRSRSASPYLNKKPTKSILKKQIVQDELSEDENDHEDQLDEFSLKNQPALSSHSSESLSSNGSASTNSLLNSDIYGGFNADFEEGISNELASNQFNSNNTKYIDYISKKRQSFLNHNYFNECFDESKVITDKRHSADVNTKTTNLSRSYSADNCQVQPQQKNSDRRRTNTTTPNKTTTKPISKTTSTSLSTNNIPNTKPKNSNENVNYKQRLNNNLKKEKIRNYKKLVNHVKKTKPLLGYDWALDNIETKLNTTNTKFEKPESYWQELSQFRNQNKEECVSNKQANFDGSTSTFFDTDSREMNGENQANGITDDDGRNHKCIHSFTLNERLFPVPIYKGKNGQSACPVCKSTRKDATIYSPQFFKISIPKSRILQPYKIQPNKRSDKKASDDTLSLAEHCVAGYQNAPKKSSNIYNMPKTKTVDLKSASGITAEMSKMTLEDLKRIQQNRDPAMSGVYNKAHAMRYELEDQHQKRLRELMPKMTT